MSLERRLRDLARIWPPAPCPACQARPAIVCVPDEDAPVPPFPEGRCPVCGRVRYTVALVIGVDCDAI
jgi:hypothetical protein